MKMRTFLLMTFLVSILLSGSSNAEIHFSDHHGYNLDFEGSTLVLENDGRHSDTVEITKDLELYVNGDKIKTSRSEKRLLQSYYEIAEDVEDEALALGLEGAKLGAKGAGLALNTLGRLVALLSDDYDIDDLEEDVEAEAEKIEFEAEDIEEKAEVIEDMVDDLMDIGDKLQDTIPELDSLRWF